MTTEELSREIRVADQRVRRAESAIVEFSRMVVPTLLDAGAAEVAKELSQRIFLLDAEAETARQLITGNPEALRLLLMDPRGRQ